MTEQKLRKRRCKHCGVRYQPQRPQQAVCGLACSIPYGREMKEKARQRAYRARKKAMKTKGDWTKEAQAVFNRFIRLRDANKPCISCGRFHQGQYHAGHYRTTAAQPALRFNEINCHKQCAPCNNHKSGNITEYRIELVRRIGEDLVEWLEIDHPPQKWTVDELKAIKKYYTRACKEILLDPQADTDPF